MTIAMALPREMRPGAHALNGGATAYNDDAELVAALHRGDRAARTVLVQRYEPLVERLVAGALGIDSEISDVIQDVFVGVFEGIRSLKDASALRSWIATLAVFTARGRIRRRRRWRWIRFLAPEDVPEVPVSGPQGETHEAVRATYRALDTLPDDERMAFSLRFISEMQLTEVASACRVSLATVKRRLARAEKRFVEAAKDHPALRERLTHRGTLDGVGRCDGDGGDGDGRGVMSDLESMMRDVARTVQGDARRRNLLPEIQARLERLDDQSRQQRRAHGTWRLTLAGAALARRGSRSSCCVRIRSPMRSTARAPAVGHTRRAGAIGERLAASESAPLALRFSDGSQVTLPPRAQAHVDELDAHGATVALEGGTVEVSVVHRARTRWEIRAGRYHIRVTGTQLRRGLGLPHRFADGDDARGFGRGHRAGPEGAGAGRDRPAAACERRDRRQRVTTQPTVVVEDATRWRRTPRRRSRRNRRLAGRSSRGEGSAVAPEPEVAAGKPVAAAPVRRARRSHAAPGRGDVDSSRSPMPSGAALETAAASRKRSRLRSATVFDDGACAFRRRGCLEAGRDRASRR